MTSGSETVVLVSPGLMVAVLSTMLLPGFEEISVTADSVESFGAAMIGCGLASGAGVMEVAGAVGIIGCFRLRTSCGRGEIKEPVGCEE